MKLQGFHKFLSQAHYQVREDYPNEDDTLH